MTEKKSSSTKLIVRILVLCVSIMAAVILIVLSPYIIKINELNKNMSAIAATATEETFRSVETSVVYDAYGEEMTTFKGVKDLYYAEIENIPEYVKNAFIAMEDRSFYQHSGIDIKGVIRAVVANVTSDSIAQGASTITQQLARNMFLSQDVTWERKINEIMLSEKLEKKFTKEQILEFYLNNIYFGNGYYGVETACRGYFGKSLSETSLSEIAFLTSIPNNPEKYDPYQNFDKTLERRNLVLDTMYELEMISSLDLELAKRDEITVVKNSSERMDYVETYIFYCATRALMERNGFEFRYIFENEQDEEQYNDEYSKMYSEYQASLFTGGYRIYTSIEPDKQQLLQESVNSVLSEFESVNEEGIYEFQGASTCIDNTTGKVCAIVGGRSQDTVGYTLNRAYQSYRQPGSSIKPLNVYTPYLELGNTPDTIVNDQYSDDGPVNADGTYLGPITLERAVWLSKNTVAWNIYREITPSYGLQFLIDMNFKRIDPAQDSGLSGSLGGFTYGVSTVEMAAGFATLCNDGKYRDTGCVVRITDSSGNILSDYSQPEEKIIYEANAARMMTSILHDDLLYGTGRNINLSNAVAAGKTGTTNDNKDGYFVGYTKYYTTSVWVGYDMPKEMSNLYGATYPGRIWNTYMEQIHEGLEMAEFEPYTLKNTSEETTEAGSEGYNGLGEGSQTSADSSQEESVAATADGYEDLGGEYNSQGNDYEGDPDDLGIEQDYNGTYGDE